MTEAANKIRVCFIAPKAYPIFNPQVEKVFGGAEVDLYLLATELAKDGNYQVSFVVADYGQPDGEMREDVRLVKSLAWGQNALVGGIKVWRAMKRADADIYVHEACSLGTTLAAAFCRLYGRKFVYRTAHTNETDGTYFRKHPVRQYFVRWAFLRADALITQNEKDVEDALRTIGRKPCVIRNACRLSDATGDNKQGFLWAARSLPIKRPELFLELAKAFPDTSFTMICPQGSGDRRYDELVQAAGQIGNLHFIQQVPFQEIDRYFERAAVFVSTSDAEGFPNTFVQACKSATPILSLRVNPDGFLDAYDCGRCADGDWERFCRMARELYDTPMGRELGLNGKSYIRRFHDINDIIQTYKQIFIGLLGKVNSR